MPKMEEAPEMQVLDTIWAHETERPKPGDRFNPYRMFTGIFIPEGICRFKALSLGAKMVYGRLCRFAGRNGHAYPAIQTLADELGIGKTQARQYVHELAMQRFINVECDAGKNSTYVFLWHAAFDGEKGRVRRTPPVNRSTTPPVNRSTTPPVNRSTTPPVNRSTPLRFTGAEESPQAGHYKNSHLNQSSASLARATPPESTDDAPSVNAEHHDRFSDETSKQKPAEGAAINHASRAIGSHPTGQEAPKNLSRTLRDVLQERIDDWNAKQQGLKRKR